MANYCTFILLISAKVYFLEPTLNFRQKREFFFNIFCFKYFYSCYEIQYTPIVEGFYFILSLAYDQFFELVNELLAFSVQKP